jgi:hypothetical protein
LRTVERRVIHCIGLLCVAAFLAGCGEDVRAIKHADDRSEPLSMSYPGSGLSGTYAPEDGGSELWSGMFGSFLPCVVGGAVPIEITGVHWESEESTKSHSVKTYVRSFDSKVDTPIGSALGTPERPDQNDLFDSVDLRDGVDGLKVTESCVKDGEMRPEANMNEVLFVVTAGSSGAKLEHISLTYTTPDGREYEVVNDWKFYLCGSEISEELRCK